jgi:hypothetical protein
LAHRSRNTFYQLRGGLERPSCQHADARAGSAAEVVEFLETFAQSERPERARELLDLAARFRDYDIVDYEICEQMVAE